jgi:hypothetical protein
MFATGASHTCPVHLPRERAVLGKLEHTRMLPQASQPSHNEFSLCCGGNADFDGYFNDTVWEDQVAYDAWVEM